MQASANLARRNGWAQSAPPQGRLAQYLATTGPLPKGSLPIGALPTGATGGGGSLRGMSAATAAPSMAREAVAARRIFNMGPP